MVSSFGLMACGDDKPSNPDNGDNLGSISSSSVIGGGDVSVPGLSSSAIAVEPEEDITQKPISGDEKQPDGSESVNSLAFNISGVAEGPFKSGAKVSVASVNATTMLETPGAGSGTVSSNLGAYSVQGTLTSAIAGVTVSGSYLDYTYDEAKTSSGLKLLTDLRERKKANVNVLTHLEYDRVKSLITTSGLSFTAAKVRAEKEVLAALGFKADSTLFEDISFYDQSLAATNLLAITTILLNEHSAAEVESFLTAIAADIALDGKWDDEALRASLADMAYNMDIGYPTSVLSSLNKGADIEYFKGPVERFWAAQYNLGSCTPANEGDVKVNGNSYSENQGMTFICQDSAWQEATPAQIANIYATTLFGACNDALIGTMKESNGTTYLCKGTAWKVADADDMKSAEIAATNGACNAANIGKVASSGGSYYMCLSGTWQKLTATPIDYSKGRAMNKKLGRGMNFGNSWDSPGDGDGAWSNPISDGDFAAVAKQGFNSVRIPVRWYTGMNNKLSGVKADVQLAINAGLTVIVNSHHNEPIYEAAKNGSLTTKLNDFKNEWKQIAQTFDSFPDDAVVFEIFNEPHDMTQDQVNQIMTAGYEAIRSVSKGKTIMFESNGYAKFAMIPKLKLPNDGNIIVTGHYYEPYTFSHQGHGYDCNGNANDGISAMPGHFASYFEDIAKAYPDINGGTVPMNMGEFGVANKGSCSAVSDTKRDAWTDAVLAQAEKYGMSWHYWCYKNCGGFEASNGSSWYGNMLNVFKKYMK